MGGDIELESRSGNSRSFLFSPRLAPPSELKKARSHSIVLSLPDPSADCYSNNSSCYETSTSSYDQDVYLDVPQTPRTPGGRIPRLCDSMMDHSMMSGGHALVPHPSEDLGSELCAKINALSIGKENRDAMRRRALQRERGLKPVRSSLGSASEVSWKGDVAGAGGSCQVRKSLEKPKTPKRRSVTNDAKTRLSWEEIDHIGSILATGVQARQALIKKKGSLVRHSK